MLLLDGPRRCLVNAWSEMPLLDEPRHCLVNASTKMLLLDGNTDYLNCMYWYIYEIIWFIF